MNGNGNAKKRLNIKVVMALMVSSYRRLQHNDPLRMAGATAFFTCFALPMILILLFQLFSIFFSRQLIGTELGEALSAALGEQGARQVRETARSFRRLANNWYMAVIGLVFLVFVATTLFKVIRTTFNDIWNIRLDRGGFVHDLKVRARSLIVIIAAGILFLAGAIIDTIEVVAGNYISRVSRFGAVLFSGALNEVAGVVVVTVWFMVLFRFVANARPSWRVCFAGGMVTGVLFSLGKAVLSAVISHTDAGAIYGAGGAIVLVLLFVFYSSFILYFGASFVKEYALLTGDHLRPSRRAYHYELQRIDQG